MASICYRAPIRLVPSYVLRAAKRQTCTKLQQDSFKFSRLVCKQIDLHSYIESAFRALFNIGVI